MKCSAVYRSEYAVMDGAKCDLEAGHQGDHFQKNGMVAGDSIRGITLDGSQGWSWPNTEVSDGISASTSA